MLYLIFSVYILIKEGTDNRLQQKIKRVTKKAYKQSVEKLLILDFSSKLHKVRHLATR